MQNGARRSQELAHLFWQVARLMADSQSVVAMRALGMSGIWSVPREENTRMISEKAQAFTESFLSGTYKALSGHGPDRVIQAAIKPLSLKASANRRRLARRGPRLVRFGAKPSN